MNWICHLLGENLFLRTVLEIRIDGQKATEMPRTALLDWMLGKLTRFKVVNGTEQRRMVSSVFWTCLKADHRRSSNNYHVRLDFYSGHGFLLVACISKPFLCNSISSVTVKPKNGMARTLHVTRVACLKPAEVVISEVWECVMSNIGICTLSSISEKNYHVCIRVVLFQPLLLCVICI